ncbi:MAG: RND family transporter [Myxococcota bacterium]
MALRNTSALALLGVLAAVAVFGPEPKRDNSIDTLLNARGASAEAYRRLKQAFGGDDLVVIEVRARDPRTVLASVEMGHALLTGASNAVLTASTAFGDMMSVLLDPSLGGVSELPRLSSRLEGPLNRELGLLAPDGRSARMFAFVDPTDVMGRMALLDSLRLLRDQLESEDATVHLGGGAVLNEALDRQSLRLETYALPLAGAASLLVLWLALARVSLVLLILAPVALSVVAVDRAYGLLGGTTNLLSVASRPVTVAILLASAVHFVLAWLDAVANKQTDPVSVALGSKQTAIILALFTTAVGFGSLSLSAVRPIQQFGLLTAAGLVTGLPVILVVLPVFLRVATRWIAPPVRTRSRLSALAVWLVLTSASKPRLVVLLGLLGAAAGMAAYPFLRVETHAIRYFPADSLVREDHQALESGGLGLQTVEVIATGTTAWVSHVAQEERYRALDAFGQRVSSLQPVLNRLDIGILAREAAYRAGAGDRFPDPLTFRSILEDPPDAVRRLWSPDGRSVRSTFLIETVDAAELRRLVSDVRNAATDHLDPVGLAVQVTGNHSLILEAQASLLGTLQTSLLLTAIVMTVVVMVVLGVGGLGLLAILPNVLPVTLTFLAMVVLDIPLDLGTAMVAALALGIAVDDTLHFGFACRNRRLRSAAHSTGKGLILSSITIAAGFSALLVSKFGPTMHFGLLTSLAVVFALLGDLVVLPASIELWFGKRTSTRSRSNGSEL